MTQTLSERAVIALTGPEAKSFLQGLVTNDVTKVAPDHPAYAALLTPQGKILFDFLVFASDDGLFLDCRKSVREALIKRLSMYKLRAQVEISPRDDLAVVLEGAADPRHPGLPPRGIAAITGTPADEAYLARRLELGIPEGDDFGSGALFALDAGFDELHGVAFDKGCYIGQELTARMKHRGTDRKRLLLATALEGALSQNTPVTSGDMALGDIISVYGAKGFALIRLDRLAEAKEPLVAAGLAVILTKQDWLV
ncbi:hypothetical protein FHS83_003395 [Rhizomicrobium palustre]|uniref:CAF17 C-terminal domain-containing protein n=1 Tax=Rhizomicrobium palustre TaxID=189966 RepID=A0A846N4R4_9PROT|nr:hypothetical protein [Rhizomicrobium palustre]